MSLLPQELAAAMSPLPVNPLLFVTQVPVPFELNDNTASNVQVSVVTPFGNHLGDTLRASRGGDLWVRYTNGALKNITRAAGFGTNGVQHGIGIAVRDPFIHWGGTKAIFSMVVGAPTNANDSTKFFWQLYEILNLDAIVANSNTVPIIVKVPNQPANYNNVTPCYGTDGRIIFACDRPRNGAAHLYPQLDEYNDIPSNTGLWSFDPLTGDLFQLDHSPSGDFNPFVDSFGRVIFTRWDHLVQDRAATGDRLALDPNANPQNKTTNGTFNYLSENTTNYDISFRPNESFPEPRTFDDQLLAQYGVQGNAINIFLPWMQNEDGTGLEILNHVGRHELTTGFRGSSFTNDPNLIQITNFPANARFNSNSINNLFNLHEDPLNPGTYFAIDCPDFGMHGSGEIVSLYGPPNVDGEHMNITYVTPRTTAGPNAFGAYRNPVPLVNGGLVASFTAASALDTNIGTATSWRSRYNFRLVALTNTGASWTNIFLTGANGLSNNVGFYVGSQLITNTSPLWEIEAVEVVARSLPTNRPSASVASVEAQVFAQEGVPIPEFQSWLRSNNLALIVSRNVTKRDRADREQPFNLRIPFAGGTQTIATNGAGNNTGKIYDIGYIQFLQGDQLRGLTMGTTNPVPGRRVLAMPMHDFMATNYNVPITNTLIGDGATRLGLDGSQATLVPARRAMTHATVNTNGQHIVRERYWITYQPGEIRTCAVCHGLNEADQRNQPLPTNPPAALRDLLRHWKDQTRYAKILSNGQSNTTYNVNFTAGPTRTNIVEATTDFTTWSPIATNPPGVSTNGLFWLNDTNATNFPQRFYRIAVP
jgi:hypothetical protein